MCVLSYTKNYIFFHIPKCGGTSVYQILPNMNKVNGIKDTHVNYINTKRVFTEIGDIKFFENAKKFTIIRNPFDRTISLYRYILEHTDHPLHEQIKDYSFTEFCFYLKDLNDESITSCYEHICDENGVINNNIKIFKLEYINNNVREISKIVNKRIYKIPHVNRSNHPFEVSVESLELIREIFKKDFETFYNEVL